jgi:DnaJ-class molecular chaperone
MKRYTMNILCKGCEGRGFIDPPYPGSAVAAVTCPCCKGEGVQAVAVSED